MRNGRVVAIFISPLAGEPMLQVKEVEAVAGAGLKGDRYAIGEGSFSKKAEDFGIIAFLKRLFIRKERRQVTLINEIFFRDTGFTFSDSRRNIVTSGVELMDLIGKKFYVGMTLMKGVKYCDPCDRPSIISGKPGFMEAFFDRGGIVAEVLEYGTIKTGDAVTPPRKNYL